MSDTLKKFLKNKIGINELKKECGDNLYAANVERPEIVYASDVISLLEKYLYEEISTQELVDWVNVIWFTDLYEYELDEEDAIASVLSLLETLDEVDAHFSSKELWRMIEALANNREYKILE